MGAKKGHAVSAETRAKIASALKGRRVAPHSEFTKGQRPHNAGRRQWLDLTCQNPDCAKPYRKVKGSVYGLKYCSRACAVVMRTGDKHVNWQGGRWIAHDGYVRVKCPRRGKYYYEHVVVAEAALGRQLRPGEIVHHLNADKQDNDRRNLLVCTNGYHRMLERKMAELWQSEHFPSYREGS